MAIVYLLDTNILSEPVRSAPNPNVIAHLHENTRKIAMAATTWHELWFGLLRIPFSPKRAIIEQYLWETLHDEVPILPYDKAAAEWFAHERARLVNNGRVPSYPDGQIAAIAAVNDLTLVTRNTADFAHFANLRVENWFE